MSSADDEQELAGKPEDNGGSAESAEPENSQGTGLMRRAMSMMASVSNPHTPHHHTAPVSIGVP